MYHTVLTVQTFLASESTDGTYNQYRMSHKGHNTNILEEKLKTMCCSNCIESAHENCSHLLPVAILQENSERMRSRMQNSIVHSEFKSQTGPCCNEFFYPALYCNCCAIQ